MDDIQMKNKLIAGVVLSIASAGSAMAEVPAAVATTVASISADGKSIFDTVFPVVGVVIGLMVVIKLFKRFIAKI
ncbi:major coat protein [Janthinobacterium sp. J1-1]|uniref:major coat protein n=1 Tax=Janthinobacterium sp. J1-1 TaxID=3065910 RepID=UPI002810B785|nr:major coat protein [Janthinobacterium sp. J1-1]